MALLQSIFAFAGPVPETKKEKRAKSETREADAKKERAKSQTEMRQAGPKREAASTKRAVSQTSARNQLDSQPTSTPQPELLPEKKQKKNIPKKENPKRELSKPQTETREADPKRETAASSKRSLSRTAKDKLDSPLTSAAKPASPRKRPVPPPLMTPSPPAPAKATAVLPVANVFGKAIGKSLPPVPPMPPVQPQGKVPQSPAKAPKLPVKLPQPPVKPAMAMKASIIQAHLQPPMSDKRRQSITSESSEKWDSSEDEGAAPAKKRAFFSFSDRQLLEDELSPMSPTSPGTLAERLAEGRRNVKQFDSAVSMAEVVKVVSPVLKGPICDKWGECLTKPKAEGDPSPTASTADPSPASESAAAAASSASSSSDSSPNTSPCKMRERPAALGALATAPCLTTSVSFPRTREMQKQAEGPFAPGKWRPADDLLHALYVQRALGADRWPRSFEAALAVALWQLPNFLLAALLAPAPAFIVPSETWLIAVPPLLILPIFTWFRLCRWDRSLMASADHALLLEAKQQLHAPLGWGDNGAVFGANLGAAFTALDLPQNELLLSRAIYRHTPRRIFLFACFFLVILLGLRFAAGMGAAAQTLTASLTILIYMVFVLDPCQIPSRAEALDDRIVCMEAAVNSMLDAFRPLLGPDGCRLPPAVQDLPTPTTPSKGGKRQRHFSVRLVTANKQTLRASVHFPSSDAISTGTDRFVVYSPLAKFGIAVIRAMDSASKCVLGESAAGSLDRSITFTPDSPGVASLSSLFAMQFSKPPRRRLRDDDLASVSTSSTFSSRGQRGQLDEAALQLAIAAVSAMSSRRKEPLEAFRMRGTGRAVIPPKSAQDEPCLVLTLPIGHLKYTEALGVSGHDVFGVVRTPNEMRRLFQKSKLKEGPLHICKLPTGSTGSKSSDFDDISNDGRSDDSSCSPRGEISDDEFGGGAKTSRPASPAKYSKIPDLTAPVQIAMLFDSFEERDACVRLLENASLVSGSPSVSEKLPDSRAVGTWLSRLAARLHDLLVA